MARQPRLLLLLVTGLLLGMVVAAGLWWYATTPATPISPVTDPLLPVVFIPAAGTSGESMIFELAAPSFRAPANLLRPALQLRLDEGWSSQEAWGIWTVGPRASLRLWLNEAADRRLALRAWALDHPAHPDGQRLTVLVNGHDCGSVAVGETPRTVGLAVPAAVQVAGYNRIELRPAYTVTQVELGTGSDDRPLAVAVCSLGLATGDRPPVLPTRRARRLARMLEQIGLRAPAFSVDPQAPGCTVRAAGTVVLPPLTPSAKTAPLLTVEASAAFDPGAGLVTLRTLAVSGGVRANQQLAPDQWQRAGADGRWQAEVALAPIGSLALIEVGQLPAGQELRLSSSLLQPRDLTSAPVQPPPVDHPGDRPDLVLIILDAARPDHFGCYGYHRDTTPRIDRLAAISSRLDNAVALAPYTLCSVPTMITGRSFLHHGVVQPGQALSPDAHTLAEILSELGYQTIAFSATPNSSRSLGFAQGCEQFVELWHGVDSAAAIDPQRLVDQVIGLLEARSDPRPLYLQVHLVPPHEPYAPPPAFAIFADPAYQGSCDGSRATLDAINRGDLQPSPADLDQIVALYDGNLRRADHAVGVLLDALARRQRWSQTVVLLTADHGEAMYEHGVMGHNETLYEEMLRVPFLLRLPPAIDRALPCTDCLVSLADIAPTFVSLAGGFMPGPSEGIDLLAAASDRQLADRVLVLRTAYQSPELGVRSARWKLLSAADGQWRLFDLAQDPGEQADVFPTRLPIAAGLAALLWQRITEPPQLQPMAVDPTTMADADRAMLETLGYIGK